MIKILGSLIIIFSSTLVGKSLCLSLKEKMDFLEDFKKFVFFAKNEIEYKRLQPDLIIRQFKCKSKLNIFLNKCLLVLQNDKNFQLVWEKVFADCSYDENKMILNFGKNLGSYDVTNQIETCNLFIENFNPNIEKIKHQINEKEKIFTVLGLCFGTMISILML